LSYSQRLLGLLERLGPPPLCPSELFHRGHDGVVGGVGAAKLRERVERLGGVVQALSKDLRDLHEQTRALAGVVRLVERQEQISMSCSSGPGSGNARRSSGRSPGNERAPS